MPARLALLLLLGIEGPVSSGNVLVDYDFGLPAVPDEDVPMEEGEDPHGKLAGLRSVQQMAETFLRTGEVEQRCDGACDPE